MSKYMDIVTGAQKVFPSNADVVEVVRCKDCKYSIEIKESDNIICRHPSQHSTYERTGDDYCSYGERE